jgi:hypothetical protein
MTNLAYERSAEPPPKRSDAQIVELVRLPPIALHAFCDEPEMIATMEAAVADRRLSRVHASVHPGGIAAAIELYRRAPSPDLIIIESRASAADLHTQLDALADVCQASTKAMVIGYANDVALYRELVVRGVAEYIVAPVGPIGIVAAISRLYQHAGAKKLGRSFAFVGAKGGNNCPGLTAKVTAAVQSTSLGTNVTLQSGSPAEGFYCLNSSNALVYVSSVSTKPANCSSVGEASLQPADYIQIQTTFTYAPLFTGITVASLLTTPITSTALIRLG